MILSLQLSFAVVPLVRFTSSKRKMGPFANPWWLQILAWLVTAIIALLNGKLVYEALDSWLEASGNWYWLIVLVAVPVSLGLSVLLVWMTFRREKPVMEEPEVSAEEVASEAAKLQRRFKRIGVALEAKPSDASMLAEAVSLAKSHHAELLLMHVVDGVGGTWYGIQTGDSESREDEIYLEALVHRLRSELRATRRAGRRCRAGLRRRRPPNWSISPRKRAWTWSSWAGTATAACSTWFTAKPSPPSAMT